MAFLIQTTEVYRVNSETEAAEIIADAKSNSNLVKYNSVKKERKAKGEVIDEWYKVTLVKQWDDEKEPFGDTTVTYQRGAF
jgi:hypothetical protein